jgi:hypothetical protein
MTNFPEIKRELIQHALNVHTSDNKQAAVQMFMNCLDAHLLSIYVKQHDYKDVQDWINHVALKESGYDAEDVREIGYDLLTEVFAEAERDQARAADVQEQKEYMKLARERGYTV